MDFKSKIKVFHPPEMDAVEAERTKWVTPNLWNEYKGGEGWDMTSKGDWSAVRVRLGYVGC